MRKAYPLPSFVFNVVPEVVDSTKMQEKVIKETKTKKEEIKMALFTDTIIVYEQIQKK